MKTIETRLRQLGPAIRKKPGMYFGRNDASAITEMVKLLAQWLIPSEADAGTGNLGVEVENGPEVIKVTLLLTGDNTRGVSPHPEDWFALDKRGYATLITAGASSHMTIDASVGGSRTVAVTAGDGAVRVKKLRSTTTNKVRIQFQPDASFGVNMEPELDRLAGVLEDIAILSPGLTVRFSAAKPPITFAWTYAHGLRSWLMKRDHSRWPLHPGTLWFEGSSTGMRVEAHLRFLHAGTSEMRSWVNGHPSQGGVHLEGLGAVLKEMFPAPDRGCRRVLFVTNPDEHSTIWLPHCFVGAMKLTLDNPRYLGPTKDILDGDEVREFVRTAAKSLPGQWAEARERRF